MDLLHEKNCATQTLTPFFILIWFTVFVRVSLGSQLLNLFISYTLPGGMVFEKIHPGNYFLTLIILLLISGVRDLLLSVLKFHPKD